MCFEKVLKNRIIRFAILLQITLLSCYVLLKSNTVLRVIYKVANPKQVKTLPITDFNEANDYILLDVRSESEYKVSHINKSQLVFYDDDISKIPIILNANKSDTIITYCSVGYRSGIFSQKLINAGYKNVYNLEGGLFYWSNLKRKLINMNDTETDSIHTFSKLWGLLTHNRIEVN